ncbi:MAG TPA: TonB-dependent receptor [Bacteroidia bacterium]|nr:TonB-dependent receptor [Bacteroidia bacterium]
MKHFLPFLFVSLWICPSAYAQTFTQTVRGSVVDADSKKALAGATIIILNLDTIKGGVTDAEGHFRITHIPVGRRALKVSYVGYEEVMMNNLVVTSGHEVVLNIEMHEHVIQGKEVQIIYEKDKTKPNNELITNSARNFNSEETDRYAGTRGDPSRMVANYAGISTSNDARNDIIVRGNSPLGVLWRLEGVDIPNPNHFSTQGATGGPVGMLNNNMLAGSDFLTGAFPAEYGNKTAAVFDLRLRNGNNEKTEFISQIGINGLELGAEGPIKKDGASYIINYRYSTFKVFNALGINFGVSGVPEYQDMSFKFNFPTSKAGVFSVWGVGGTSSISILDRNRDTSNWSYVSQGQDLVFGSSMGATGISHLYFFSPNISGKAVVSASGTTNISTVDTLSKTRQDFRLYDNHSLDWQYTGSYTLSDKINSHHLIKAGVSFTQMFIDYKTYYYSTTYHMNIDQLRANNNTGLGQAYVHWQYKITDKLSFNSGLHYQYFTLNGSQALEPRAGLRWQWKPKHAFSLAYGMHSQIQPIIYYYYKSYNTTTGQYSQTDLNMGLSRSQHLVAGYDFNIGHDFRLKIETYYQYLYDIPVTAFHSNSFSMLNVGNDLDGLPLVDSLKNGGTGQNYGFEFTIEKFFSRHFYFLSTLSVFNSTYKGSDGVERPTAYDGLYVYNLLGGYELPLGKSKNKIIALDVKFTTAGGNRYTPIDVAASIPARSAVYIDNEAFSQRFPPYSRFDVKLMFRINHRKTSQMFFVTVENVLNTQNILRQTYDETTQTIHTEFQLGVFPYGGYRIEF